MASDDNEHFESLDDLKRAWRDGQPAKTAGPRDLNQQAKSIVDRAVARLAEPLESVESPEIVYLRAANGFLQEVEAPEAPAGVTVPIRQQVAV